MLFLSPQVNKKHYYLGYDDLNRFISYFYQINWIQELNPSNILEIWIGNKTVSTYLKTQGFNVHTCDFDSTLQPDTCADIRNLPFQNNSFDVILCCEVLEHLPFSELNKVIDELARISSKNLIISVPYCSANFEFLIRFPFIYKLTSFIFSKGRRYIYLLMRIPKFYKKFHFDGQHYWELWTKWHSLSVFKSILLTQFLIEKEITPVLNPYHYFFYLKKR